ncbi:hypothetical protein SETIT_4G178400v2 [Setaria italica]|uniref:Uncharacterized protein n=1 Tax=Setaria italica TaxID=4555 RepID=A0A368QVG6_SETIT|nr:hypothetical protein SETIT_4G178400v2 [Setaria italica]
MVDLTQAQLSARLNHIPGSPFCSALRFSEDDDSRWERAEPRPKLCPISIPTRIIRQLLVCSCRCRRRRWKRRRSGLLRGCATGKSSTVRTPKVVAATCGSLFVGAVPGEPARKDNDPHVFYIILIWR